MATLKAAGLIRSQRGAKGGYVLSRPPDKIKLSEVFDVFEGPVITVECVSNEKYCAKAEFVWQGSLVGDAAAITKRSAVDDLPGSDREIERPEDPIIKYKEE